MSTDRASSMQLLMIFSVSMYIQELRSELLFPGGIDESPDCGVLVEHLKREGRISNADVLRIVAKVTEIMNREPNLVRMEDPVTVVGDLYVELQVHENQLLGTVNSTT